MAKTDICMPFYIGDYLADTMWLSTEQHGAYVLLIFAYWKNRGPLKDDNLQLAKITGLMLGAWRKHRPSIAKYFQVSNGFWSHKRIDALIEKQARAEKVNSDRAKRAAAARWENVNDDARSNAYAMLERCPLKSKSKSDSISEFQSLGAMDSEAELLEGCKAVLGEKTMTQWGGVWRKRIRSKPGKVKRVIMAMAQELKERKTIKNPGGYANDLWRRFAD